MLNANPHMLIALARTMPAMPPESWWLAIAVIVLLGAAAVIDARTARVPDPIIFAGLLLTVGAQGFFMSWPFASLHLAVALAAGFFFYGVNYIWRRLKKHDAIGMGDTKWTMLAVACFGIGPAIIAWLAGAWLALGWISMLKLLKRPVARVHFAPFLFVALLAGIYWLRLR